MTEEETPRGAILQRDKKTYAVVPRTPMGLVTPEHLENVARVARQFDIPVIKITSGQRLALVGIEKEQVEPVWEALGMGVGHAVELCFHYVQACPGNNWCRYGVQDSLGLGARLDKEFYGMAMPAKVKMGISGCPLNCAESLVRDFGAYGNKKGWNVYVGGYSGQKPRAGELIVKKVPEDEVVEIARKLVPHYQENAKGRERLSKFVARVGIEEIRRVLGYPDPA